MKFLRSLLKNNFHIILIFIVIIFLKLPSVYEPRWSIDEGVYMAVVQEMHHGERLYVDVWDNKPIPFYLIWNISYSLFRSSITPIRIVGFLLGIVDSVFILLITRKLIGKYYLKLGARYKIVLESIVLIGSALLFHTPLFEGNTANGEAFFIPLVLAGAYFALKRGRYNLYISGLFFGYAILMKLNAVLDLFAFMSLVFAQDLKARNFKFANTLKLSFSAFFPIIITLVGAFIVGNLSEYVKTILFLNSNNFINRIDTYAITFIKETLLIRLVILLAVTLLLILLYYKNKIRKELLLVVIWFLSSLFASLISGRLYAHYFLQAIIPSIFLFSYFCVVYIKQRTISLVSLILIIIIAILLPFKIFSDKKSYFIHYYPSSYKYILKRLKYENYARLFDNNYDSKEKFYNFLKSETPSNATMFYWSTNQAEDSAWAYVTSQRTTPSKYVAYFHIIDFDKDGKSKTAKILKNNLPDIIVVRTDADDYPELDQIISSDYSLNYEIGIYNVFLKDEKIQR